jgi:hypothetical protein
MWNSFDHTWITTGNKKLLKPSAVDDDDLSLLEWAHIIQSRCTEALKMMLWLQHKQKDATTKNQMTWKSRTKKTEVAVSTSTSTLQLIWGHFQTYSGIEIQQIWLTMGIYY